METMTPTRFSMNKSLIFNGSFVAPTKRTTSVKYARNSFHFIVLVTAALVFVMLTTLVSDVEGARFSGYSKMSHRKKAGGGDAGPCPKGYTKNESGKCQKISYVPLPPSNNYHTKPNRIDNVGYNRHHYGHQVYGRAPRYPNSPQSQQLQLIGNDYRRIYRNPNFYGNRNQPNNNFLQTVMRLKRKFLNH